MRFIALKILAADRTKFLGLVFAVAFASMLMSHQLSMFVGILRRTSSIVEDASCAEVWVMDPRVRYLDEVRPLPDGALDRVRAVPGVAWAAPFQKTTVPVTGPGGEFQLAFLIGVDDATLAGAPRTLLWGTLAALREPDAIIVDDVGYAALFAGRPFERRTLELGGRRAVVVGVCRCSPPFQTLPVVYARASVARSFSSHERPLSFVIARLEARSDLSKMTRSIENATGLRAVSRADFLWMTRRYYLEHTGIPANFGITVSLAFVVGAVVAGQTFSMFTLEHIRELAALKAIGFTNAQLTRIVLLQGGAVAGPGFSLGVCASALFFFATENVPELRGFYLPWPVVVLTGAAVVAIVALASVASLRRVHRLDPALVIRS